MNQIDTGRFIASCRKEKGLTQAQLAEKLNITDRAVSKYKTGVFHSYSYHINITTPCLYGSSCPYHIKKTSSINV